MILVAEERKCIHAWLYNNVYTLLLRSRQIRNVWNNKAKAHLGKISSHEAVANHFGALITQGLLIRTRG